MAETFNVVQFFPDGTHEAIRERVGAQEAVETARDYTLATRPGVILGAIQRVIITDSDDFTVFEWKHGEGVTFPPESAGRQ
jgi:hypothetical protein